MNNIEKSYELAKELYSSLNVDVEKALTILDTIPISVHCWQGDDVGGFESGSKELTGGIQSTGAYPGKATTALELRKDLEKAFSLIPGTKKLNLHAIYLENNGEFVDRNEIEPKHFENWVSWAKSQDIGLDFNPTLFSHEKSNDGLTLSHPDENIRNFWIEHVRRSRIISEYFGKELGKPSVMNIWAPDGFKDTPADKLTPRARFKDSLDKSLSDTFDSEHHKVAIESKLFGIGSESYVVGSHEFCMGYAMQNNTLLCLDAGHFHPTEVISNKISALSLFTDELLLHVSRPVRWDSDHIITLDDELISIAQEIVRPNLLDKTNIGLDFFDGSVNRIAAWVIGTRNMLKALLIALLEPTKELVDAETSFNFTKRLALQEELKSYPWQAIWNYYCYKNNIPAGIEWLEDVKKYEETVLKSRAN